jgi:cell division protein FtsB
LADEGDKEGVDWGNVPQWVSAVCAFALAALAIYGLFFSTTSQALVSYLQSELAVRNQRIATMELREQQLQLSISQTQATLGDLNEQRTGLEKQVADLNAEREALSRKAESLGSTLSSTEFSLVREKISAKLASTIVSTLSLNLDTELWSAQGVQARSVRPWNDYFAFIKKTAEELNERDQALGQTIVARFVDQCGARFSTQTVRIPAFRQAKGEEIISSFDRNDHPSARKLDVYVKQIETMQTGIVRCFNSTTPQ